MSSKPGIGSTFFVDVPCVSQINLPSFDAPLMAEGHAEGQGRLVLIADDETLSSWMAYA